MFLFLFFGVMTKTKHRSMQIIMINHFFLFNIFSTIYIIYYVGLDCADTVDHINFQING